MDSARVPRSSLYGMVFGFLLAGYSEWLQRVDALPDAPKSQAAALVRGEQGAAGEARAGALDRSWMTGGSVQWIPSSKRESRDSVVRASSERSFLK